MSIRSGYATPLCKHGDETDCDHCTIGCERCGVLEVDDDGLCYDCAFGRAEERADLLHDQMKERD